MDPHVQFPSYRGAKKRRSGTRSSPLGLCFESATRYTRAISVSVVSSSAFDLHAITAYNRLIQQQHALFV